MDKLIDQLNNIELYFNDFHYLDNSEIMKDLYLLTKDQFLDSYKYISEEEYNLMIEKVKF